MKRRLRVARCEEIPQGCAKVIETDGREIGIFNINGTYTAVLNVCPHELGPICLGRVTGTTLPSQPGDYIWGREGEILTCPWHGWEFDLVSGRALADPHRRLKKFDVEVEEDTIYVYC